MSTITRIKEVISAGVNGVIDRMENPQLMTEQYVKDAQADLMRVKLETASVLAQEKGIKRDIEKLNKEISSMETYARKAVESGSDEDARKFLANKLELESKKYDMEAKYESATGNSQSMMKMLKEFEGNVHSMDERRAEVRTTAKMTGAKNVINKTYDRMTGYNSKLTSFDKMEAKANYTYDKACSVETLNQLNNNSISSLRRKYDEVTDARVEAELLKLKMPATE